MTSTKKNKKNKHRPAGTRGNKPLVNGIILIAVAVLLAVYFSLNGMWNPATIIVTILLVLLSALQIYIQLRFFNKK